MIRDVILLTMRFTVVAEHVRMGSLAQTDAKQQVLA